MMDLPKLHKDLMGYFSKATGRNVLKVEYDEGEDTLKLYLSPQTLTECIEWKGDEAVSVEKIKCCMDNMKEEVKDYLYTFAHQNNLCPRLGGEQLGNIQNIINKHLGKRFL